MKFEMTYNDALLIQKAQMAYYRQSIGRSGVKAIMKRTVPCYFNPCAQVSVSRINELVPRGGDFEGLLKRYPKNPDPTNAAWHDAIRNGKIYH